MRRRFILISISLASCLCLMIALSLITQISPVSAQNTLVGDNITVDAWGNSFRGVKDVTVAFGQVMTTGNTDAHYVAGCLVGGTDMGIRLSTTSLPTPLYSNIWLGKGSGGVGFATQSAVGQSHWADIAYYPGLDLLKYPLALGRTWAADRMFVNASDYIDRVAVIDSLSETVAVPAGTFADCVKTSRVFSYSYTPQNWDITLTELWFAKQVGLVKIVTTHHDGSVIHGELVSYSVSSADPNDYLPSDMGNKWVYQWDSSPSSETIEVTETWSTHMPSYAVAGPIDIFTNAEYAEGQPGAVHIALTYEISSAVSFVKSPEEEDFRLYYWNGFGWEDVTTSLDTTNHIVYGEVAKLGTFFVGSFHPTGTGTSVSVDLDGMFNVTYESVSSAGYTSVNFYDHPLPSWWGPIPSGIHMLGGLVEVMTTAVHDGSVGVIGDISAVESETINESSLMMFYWNGFGWEHVGSTLNPTTNTVSASGALPLSSLIFFLGAPELPSATGTGMVNVSPTSGTIQGLMAVSENSLPTEGKPNVAFPHGLFEFQITDLTPGQSVNVTLTLPSTVPAGVQYWKYGPTPDNHSAHWYQVPVVSINGNVITIRLIDGGLGDDDLTANGIIVDQGGPGWPPTPIGGGAHNAPVFPSMYIGIGAALGAGIVAYAVRRRLATR